MINKKVDSMTSRSMNELLALLTLVLSFDGAGLEYDVFRS